MWYKLWKIYRKINCSWRFWAKLEKLRTIFKTIISVFHESLNNVSYLQLRFPHDIIWLEKLQEIWNLDPHWPWHPSHSTFSSITSRQHKSFVFHESIRNNILISIKQHWNFFASDREWIFFCAVSCSETTEKYKCPTHPLHNPKIHSYRSKIDWEEGEQIYNLCSILCAKKKSYETSSDLFSTRIYLQP